MAHEPDGIIDFGATPAISTGLSGDELADALIYGSLWTDASLTYSFTDSASDYNSTAYGNPQASLSVMSATQIISAEYWLDQYASISGLSFTELDGANGALDEDQEATIRFANTTDASTAYAFLPSSAEVSGDVWFGGSGVNPSFGDYHWATVGHEIGHALGLAHGQDEGGISGVLPGDVNSSEYSIMTYNAYPFAPPIGYTNEQWGYAQTLMIADIAAIQFLYGANFAENSSSTNYTFSITTGEMFVDGVGQGATGANRVYRTIWDGDGAGDHYDLSNYTTDISINLNPGEYSDLDLNGNFQRADLGRYSADGAGAHVARGHIFNALQFEDDLRSLIENATAGSGDDILIGNAANNSLIGGAGNDLFKGGLGDDLLEGGQGQDIAQYSLNITAYSLADLGNGQTSITLLASGEVDILYEIEQVQFADILIELDNQAPVTVSTLANISSQFNSLLDGSEAAYQFASHFADANGDVLNFSATGLPDGLTIDAATGIISGQLTAAIASYEVTIIATDPLGASVSSQFTWAITENPNAVPVATSIADIQLQQDSILSSADELYLFATYFSDADGDTLTYSATGLPNGLTIDAATGRISGQLTANVATYAVSIIATDPTGATAIANFNWLVSEIPNIVPIAADIEDVSTLQDTRIDGSLDIYQFATYFSDADDDTLSYTISGLPDGLSMDDAGIVSGVLNAEVGTYQVQINADDGQGGSVQMSFEWVVEAKPIIKSPTPAPIPTPTPDSNDVLMGSDLSDAIFKAFGNIEISGAAGSDILTVLSGINKIDGGADSDLLIGGFLSDTLIGGDGNDAIRGDASELLGGSDYIEGGQGYDVLMGGQGADLFAFAVGDGSNVIGQFKIDKVDLTITNDHSVTVEAADFQSGIDQIQLTGFEGLNAENVMDFISVVDGHMQFSAQNVDITFYDILQSQLTAQDFIFA